MKRLIPVALTMLFVFQTLGRAEDASFDNCRLADAKGTQAKAALIFSDSTSDIAIRAEGQDSVSIPYANLDKVSYEYTKKHRITSGALLLAFTPFGAGGLLMLTKSKSHWLYVDFHDQNGKETVVLKLDKKNFTRIFDAFKSHTGMAVVMLGDASKGPKRGSSGAGLSSATP
jgi:hypothetical protein